MVDAVATRISDDCGLLTRSEAEEQFLTAIRRAGVDDGCSDVEELADAELFYEQCLPAIRTIECSDFTTMDDWLPASCAGQLLIEP